MHARAQALFGDVLDLVTDEQLALPTPCSDWTVADLIAHVDAGNLRVAHMGGRDPIDLPDDRITAHAASSAEARAVFDADDGMTRLFDASGPCPVRSSWRSDPATSTPRLGPGDGNRRRHRSRSRARRSDLRRDQPDPRRFAPRRRPTVRRAATVSARSPDRRPDGGLPRPHRHIAVRPAQPAASLAMRLMPSTRSSSPSANENRA